MKLCLIWRRCPCCYLTVEFTALSCSLRSSLADFNLRKWNSLLHSLLCTIARSVAPSSQPALHMTAGFGIKERKLWADEMFAAIRRPWRGFTVQPARFAFTLQMLGWRHVSGQLVVMQVGGGGRCIKDSLTEIDDGRRLMTFQERLFKAKI